VGIILPTLQYELRQGYTKEFMGTYVHPELFNAIAMWVSAKYLLTVSEIMDNINFQAHLLEVDSNDHVQNTLARIKKENENLKSNVNHLNKVIINNEKRMVPKEYKEHYNLMLYYDSSYT
jgi:hypothetical protein